MGVSSGCSTLAGCPACTNLRRESECHSSHSEPQPRIESPSSTDGREITEGELSATENQNWFFTFGAGQKFDGYYVRVVNSTFLEARLKMVEKFGIFWCSQYNLLDFESEGLHEKLDKLEDL